MMPKHSQGWRDHRPSSWFAELIGFVLCIAFGLFFGGVLYLWLNPA